MDRAELERLDRESLVQRAQAAGIKRARVLTRPELVDELLRLDPQLDESTLKKSRGFFGRARDLLTRVVERGLHLPDAADRLRAMALGTTTQVPRPEPQAVPTVTLAEIYAAQGHRQRAIETLQRVLEAEPDHTAARNLLQKLQAADYVLPKPPLPPEPTREEEERAELEAEADFRGDEEVDEEEEVEEEEVEEEDAEEEIEATSAPISSASPTLVFGEEDASASGAVDERAPSTPRVEEPITIPRADKRLLDECVAIPFGEDGTYVWWRLSHLTHQEIQEERFVVRALVVVPSWDGPKQVTRDIACQPEEGELSLRGFPSNAVVRIAVGVLRGPAKDFVPLAHSPALEMTTSRELVRWTVTGVEAVSSDDPSAGAIARAREGASRAGLV